MSRDPQVPAANRCAHAGRLVSSERAIPADEFDFVFPNGPLVGCSHLLCRECGARVENRARLRLAEGVSLEEAARRRQGPWESLEAQGVLVPDQVYRFYACECELWVEYTFSDMEREVGDWIDPLPPWRCAGHPLLAAGAAVDGVPIDGDTDLEDLVRASFTAGEPAGRPEFTREYRACWVHRLFHLLGHTPLAAALARAVAPMLRDGQPLARGAALEFYRREPLAPGAAEVAAAAQSSPELFLGVADPLDPEHDLSRSLRATLGGLLEAAGDAGRQPEPALVALAREAALWEEPNPPALLRALARVDPPWLVDEAAAILAANPTSEVASDLLYVFGRELGEQAVPAVAGVAAARLLPADELERLISLYITVPALRERILAALRQA